MEASHERKIFCRHLPRKSSGLSKKAGTQIVDRSWQSFKSFVPNTLARRAGNSVNPKLAQAAYMWSWRKNLGHISKSCFQHALAQLCRKGT